MKRLLGIVSTIVILLLLCSGAFAEFVNFMLWLFTLQYSQPTTSIAGGIIVRILTFAVSFGLVGFIFNLIGLFNSKIMSFAYFVISTLVAFALSYVVWIVEKYILIIGIVLGVIALLLATCFVCVLIKKDRTSKSEE